MLKTGVVYEAKPALSIKPLDDPREFLVNDDVLNMEEGHSISSWFCPYFCPCDKRMEETEKCFHHQRYLLTEPRCTANVNNRETAHC